MSVVIVGGNECMERRYKMLCEEYNCKSKVFTKMTGSMGDRIGTPDLIVFFTDTVSHKMIRCALSRVDTAKTGIVRSHSGSIAALRAILEAHT